MTVLLRSRSITGGPPSLSEVALCKRFHPIVYFTAI